jgi:hypothetical protein
MPSYHHHQLGTLIAIYTKCKSVIKIYTSNWSYDDLKSIRPNKYNFYGQANHRRFFGLVSSAKKAKTPISTSSSNLATPKSTAAKAMTPIKHIENLNNLPYTYKEHSISYLITKQINTNVKIITHNTHVRSFVNSFNFSTFCAQVNPNLLIILKQIQRKNANPLTLLEQNS